MGNIPCGSHEKSHSKYNASYFIDKYGEKVVLDTARDAIQRELIMQKVPEINQKHKEAIRNAKIESIHQINQTEFDITNQMAERVKELEVEHPGAVSKAQKKHDMSAEDIMGRRIIQEEASKLRKETHRRYENDEKHTEDKIQQDIDKRTAKLQKKRKDTFKEYAEMTDAQRESVRKDIRKRYRKDLEQTRRNSEQEIELEGGTDIQSVDFSSSHPAKEIEEMRRKGGVLSVEGEEKIKGGGIIEHLSSKDVLPRGCFGC